ncbi:unnamed protein product [Periconia digitata]|uniref:Uncharacterized protein n=1 Tax=Periconia digitata TaxID=1303443 RepID=A0A9W4UIW3_9PLEO|nr:unnamed protein product [Periconia digitata]
MPVTIPSPEYAHIARSLWYAKEKRPCAWILNVSTHLLPLHIILLPIVQSIELLNFIDQADSWPVCGSSSLLKVDASVNFPIIISFGSFPFPSTKSSYVIGSNPLVDMDGVCTALNISDEQKCTASAISINGLFCRFHAKQCQGLYIGYKRRNAQLDSMVASPPQFLAKSKWQTVQFNDVDDEDLLAELHDYLFKKYALLDRVIRARKLHQSRFYADNSDFGHKTYLDKLLNDRLTTLRALERLEKRTAEVLYQKQKWFHWVRQEQAQEEQARENEANHIKHEAAMFKRHWKELQSRSRAKRQEEDKKREEAFLEKVFKERQDARTDSADADEVDWDPIEDEVEEEKERYIHLLKHLLWLQDSSVEHYEEYETTVASDEAPTAAEFALDSTLLSKAKKKRAKKQAKALAVPAQNTKNAGGDANDDRENRIKII